MIVRALTDADRSAWDALYQAYAQFYDVPQTPQMRATVWDWINDPTNEVNAFVADDDGTLVGIAHYRAFMRPLAAATGLFLDDLFVSPTARGTGAAAALIEAVRGQQRRRAILSCAGSQRLTMHVRGAFMTRSRKQVIGSPTISPFNWLFSHNLVV
jgi:GNAT superfamily N-acetyltransferase